MINLKFYYEHSLLGYFLRRAKEKWFIRLPKQFNLSGVELRLDCLPREMQKVVFSGVYECSEIKAIGGFLTKEDKVLEIGGAIGFVGLYCRKVAGVGELVSVEPNPTTISYLRRNYELNGLVPTVVEGALAATDGPVQFQTSDLFYGDSLAATRNQAGSKMITVEGVSFATLVRRVGLAFTTLIIDIEGGEQFLPVSQIPDHVTKVIIELHPEFIGAPAAFRVLGDLMRAGFDVQSQYSNVWALQRK